jgi:hypothetical protein
MDPSVLKYERREGTLLEQEKRLQLPDAMMPPIWNFNDSRQGRDTEGRILPMQD